MKKYKRTRMGVREIDVYYLLTPGAQPECGLTTTVDQVASNNSPNNAGARNTEAANQDALLIRDMEETNSWARSGFQMFFGWFAWQFTINGLALGWFAIYKGPIPTFTRAIYAMFIGWNLLGTIGTLLVHKSLLDCDLRIKKVIETLTQHYGSGDPGWKPQSAVPLQAVNTVFMFCAVTTFTSMAFWTIVFVSWGR